MTVPGEGFQGLGYEAGQPSSEPGLALLAAGRSRELERELMVLEVGCAAHAPAFVRAALREITELAGVRDDVILVASELVANAVMHSGGSAKDMILVRMVLIGGDVLISVDDPGLSDDTPRMRDPDVSRAGGHGLWIVNQLARQWGCERRGAHRVWAQLATGGG